MKRSKLVWWFTALNTFHDVYAYNSNFLRTLMVNIISKRCFTKLSKEILVVCWQNFGKSWLNNIYNIQNCMKERYSLHEDFGHSLCDTESKCRCNVLPTWLQSVEFKNCILVVTYLFYSILTTYAVARTHTHRNYI